VLKESPIADSPYQAKTHDEVHHQPCCLGDADLAEGDTAKPDPVGRSFGRDSRTWRFHHRFEPLKI